MNLGKTLRNKFMNEKIKQIVILIIVLVIIYFSYNFIFKKDIYKGFYYPDGCLTCEDKYIFSPALNSAEDCIRWAEGLKSNSSNPNDTWECGKNCKLKDSFNVCEKTFDE